MKSGRHLALVLAATLALASCGGSDGDPTATEGSPVDATETEGSSRDDEASAGPVQATRDRADFIDEKQTSGGGTVIVTTSCDVNGAQLISVAAEGLEAGQMFAGEIEPAAGGDLDFSTGPEGFGQGARQTTLDEPSYTVSFPDLDGGMTFDVEGCV